jgi:hypothetical protein
MPSLHWANSNNPAIRSYTGGTTSHMKFYPVLGDGTVGTGIDSGYGIDVDFAIVGQLAFPTAGVYNFYFQTDDGGGIGFDNQVTKLTGTVVPRSGSGTINPGKLTAVRGFPYIAGQNAEGDFGNYFSINVPASSDGSALVVEFEIDYRAKDGYNYLSLTVQDPVTGLYRDIVPASTDLLTSGTTPSWPSWSTAYHPKWPSVSESAGNLIWVNRGPAADCVWAASTVFKAAGTEILDGNGNGQKAYRTGISNASAAPTFNTAVLGLTSDGSALVWQNDGTKSTVTTFDLSIRNAVIQVNYTPSSASNSRALTTDEVSLALTQTLGKVQVRYGLINLNGAAVPAPPQNAGELDVYEIWCEATAG